MIYNFQYRIESFNQGDSKIFVLYFPENTELPVLGEYFTINENMTQEEIDTMIVNLVPVYKWIRFEENASAKSVVENLVGGPKSQIKTSVVPEQLPPPEKTPQELEQELLDQIKNKETDIRRQRNTLLFLTDYTQTEDYIKDDKEDWKNYRQALRDITDQETFPDSVVWPEPPTEVNRLINFNQLI
jgi:hypothetical protein